MFCCFLVTAAVQGGIARQQLGRLHEHIEEKELQISSIRSVLEKVQEAQAQHMEQMRVRFVNHGSGHDVCVCVCVQYESTFEDLKHLVIVYKGTSLHSLSLEVVTSGGRLAANNKEVLEAYCC